MTRKTFVRFPQRLSTAALAALLVAGCGGGKSTTSSSDEDELTMTANESTEDTSQAIVLGDDDFARPSGAEFEPGSSTIADLRSGGRSQLGVALRALAAGISLCGSSVDVQVKTKTDSCRDIGVGGTYRGGVTVTFNGCTLPWGGKLDGVVDVDVTKSLASGATCAPRAMIDVKHQVTFTNIRHERPSGFRLEIPTQVGTAMTTRPIGTAPTDITLSIAGERKRFSAANAVVMDHQYDGSASVSLSILPPQSVTSGMLTIQHLLARYTATLTADQVTRTPLCCRPIGGSLHVVRTGSVTSDRTWTYGPTCGAVSVNGAAVNVPECL